MLQKWSFLGLKNKILFKWRREHIWLRWNHYCLLISLIRLILTFLDYNRWIYWLDIRPKNIHSITSLYINRFGARFFFWLFYFDSFLFHLRYILMVSIFGKLYFFLAISLLVFNALKSYCLFGLIGGGHWHRRVKFCSENIEFKSQTTAAANKKCGNFAKFGFDCSFVMIFVEIQSETSRSTCHDAFIRQLIIQSHEQASNWFQRQREKREKKTR